jgi:phage shock protein C
LESSEQETAGRHGGMSGITYKDEVTRQGDSLAATGQLAPQARIANGGAMAQTRKLHRSRTDRKLAGVCGGLAQYSNVDATLIRVLFVALTVLAGVGPVLYLVMWIVVPQEP